LPNDTLVLINPPAEKTGEPWYEKPDYARMALTCLAGHFRETTGLRPVLIDCKLQRLSLDEVEKAVAALAPRVVGLTALTNEVNSAARTAALVRKALPGAVIVLGGVHLTALPERTMDEFPVFDAGVIGEGEETLCGLWGALVRGEGLHSVPGLIYREGGMLVRTAPRPPAEELDRIVHPAWDLLPRSKIHMTMTSRGCPFQCPFCFNPNGRKVRTRSVGKVLDELQEAVEERGAREIFFADEVFTFDTERANVLLRGMIARGIHRKATFSAQTHVSFVKEETFRLMKEANVTTLCLGIESGDEETLRALGKGTTVEKILAVGRLAKRTGVGVESAFILGQPNETRETIGRTIDLAVRLNPEKPVFGIMVPYPGTRVWEMAQKGEGGYSLLSKDWSDFNKQIGSALDFTAIPRREVEKLQLWAYCKVFLWNHRYLEFLAFAWRYRAAGLAIARKLLRGRGANIRHFPK
jgi:anaerobic magnesium-protoporphyrin IX monomethyl ester cyclase